MNDLAAILLVVGLAAFVPSVATALWLVWRFICAIVYRRAVRKTQEYFDRSRRNDLIVYVLRIPPEIKV